jgi:uncharacterized protein (TIGR02646 family)
VIHIDRNRLDSQGNPIQPDDAWSARAKTATAAAISEEAAHVVKESVYRDPSVKMALEELFHRKCAYCETPLSEVGWQVEHFRPKNRVAERRDHPGYYWLAYEWSNLYPSCAPCNQNLEDKPIWGEPVPGETAGKWDKFPLEVEVNRAMSPEDDLGAEKPLLLDPCSDDPELSLRYTVEGDIGPVPGDRRAEATIQILHLKRRRLRDRRKQHIDLIVLLLKRLRDFEELGEMATAAELKEDLNRKVFADSSPFAGAARFVRSDPDAFGI